MKKFIFINLLVLLTVAVIFRVYRDKLPKIYLPQFFENQILAGPPKVAIQPFIGIDTATVQEVKRAIEKYYAFEVNVLPEISLPPSAESVRIAALKPYQPAPNSYRADSLLRFLKRNTPYEFKYVIGLTHRDISTTKKMNGKVKEPAWMYSNWGIFGLGFCPGRSCIVSTYRLGSGAWGNTAKINTRLRKIAMHELGHNLGLPHCPDPKCFMRSAKETILTIDAAPEDLCQVCKQKIGH